MKKALLFLCAAFFVSAGAEIVAEDYYISGRRALNGAECTVEHVLFDTLMLKLRVGESAEVKTELLPRDAVGREIEYKTDSGGGVISVREQGEGLYITAQKAGNAAVTAIAENGKRAELTVYAEEEKEPDASEEPEEREARDVSPDFFKNAERILICAAAVFIFRGVILLVKRGREDEDTR